MLISLWIKALGVEMVPLQLGIMAITVGFVNRSPTPWKGKSPFLIGLLLKNCYASASFMKNNIAKHIGVKMKP